MRPALDHRPPGPRDWKLTAGYDNTTVHLRPRNDRAWHPLDEDCHCGPKPMRLPGDGRQLYVHTALDGRGPVEVEVPPMSAIATCVCPWEYITNRCPVHCLPGPPSPPSKPSPPGPARP